MSERLSIHTWGFFDDAGHPRRPDGIAVSAESPHAAFTRIRSHIAHHGGTCTETQTTRTLDGWFIGARWETPARSDGTAARMWHMVTLESDSWPAAPAPVPDPTSRRREVGGEECP